jgi:hypothetical protein
MGLAARAPERIPRGIRVAKLEDGIRGIARKRVLRANQEV